MKSWQRLAVYPESNSTYFIIMRQTVSVLFAVIMLFLSIDVMAQKPKGQRQMTVDFTVNNDVISNYNTDSLRQTLYNPVDSGVFIISHRGD